jgi:uncharacterized protein
MPIRAQTAMLKPGPARKVTIHLNEDTSTGSDFIHEQVFSFLFARGIAGATVFRPQAGFGGHHYKHSQEGHGTERSHLPVQIQFVEEPHVVNALLPALFDLVVDGMIEMHDTVVLRAARQEPPY